SAQASVFARAAVGDIDGDRKPDVVVATLQGALIALNTRGQLLNGFPVQVTRVDKNDISPANWISNGIAADVTLADMNGDGALEILLAGLDGKLHQYDGTGRSAFGFPVDISHEGRRTKIVAPPVVADMNGDGV